MATATAPMPAQPISGVTPAERKEVTVMTVWPSVAALGPGRALGRAFAIQWPDVYIFRLGNLLALLSIPIVLPLYFLKVLPFIGTRYVLTNRRIVVLRGITGKEEKFVDLDRFDTVEVVVQPGQEWYHAGDLVFKQGAVETFRLEGVSRPEAFRATCLKSQMAHAGVKKARERQRT
ncbi:MAG TPA: PH domain-containing protein [Pirellulaceae bacterium]|nr:PH domain-containing protein [Pirellulaceae bacterium]